MEKDENKEEVALVVYDTPIDGIKEILAEGMPEHVDLTSLFYTPEGKRFANQVKSQSDFTLIGILFPLIMELLEKLLPKLIDISRDKRFKTFYEEKVAESDELNENSRNIIGSIPDIIEFMLESLDESSNEKPETSFSEIFGSKAKERFVGNMVFSLHSYLQAYIDSIIEFLIRNDLVRKQFLGYWDSRKLNPRIGLSELDEISGDKYDAITEFVKRSLTLNLVKRINVICTALNCKQQLSNLLKELNAEQIVDKLRFLCDQRNRIAHGTPAPDISEYGIEMEELDWKALKDSLIEEIFKVWPNPPEGVFAIIELACDWAESVAVTDYFALLDYLPKSAILYPAVFDYVIHDAIREIEEKQDD